MTEPRAYIMGDKPRQELFGDYADVLPFPGATDNEARLERLEQGLRAEVPALVDIAEDVLSKLQGRPTCKPHVMCWLAVTQNHFLNGRHDATRKASVTALEIARALGDAETLAKAYNFHGVSCQVTGNLSEAIPSMLQGLRAAHSAGSRRRTGGLLSNLGLALFDAGRLGSAQECFRRSIVASPDPESRVNLAQLLLELGNHVDALKVAWEAVHLTADPKSPDHRAVRVHAEVTLTLILAAVGDVVHASDHAKSAFSYAQNSGKTAQYLAQLNLLLIDAYDPSKAIETRQALLSALGESSFEYYRISRTIAIAALQAMGHADEAAELLREVIKRDAINRATLISPDTIIEPLNAFESALDDQAAHLIHDRHSSLFAQAVRQSAAKHQRVEELVRLAIRTELREEDAFASGEHVYRVSRLAELLASNAGCTEEEVRVVRLAGLLHDLGKVCIPDQVLLKPGSLTAAELAVIRRHPKDGAELINHLQDGALTVVAKAVEHVHERWDGAGYPSGLSGEQIPLAARFVAITESFDVMTHRRWRREARTFETAIEEIQRGAGAQFDPRLCNVFLSLIQRLHSETENLDRFLAEGAEGSPVVHEQRLLSHLLRPDRAWLDPSAQ